MDATGARRPRAGKRRSANEEPGRAQRSQQRGTILIVEDDLDARMVLEEFLEAHGYSTTLACSGDEGAVLLRSDLPFDLVVLDLMLPRQSGLELLRELRAMDGPRKGLPVIVASAHAPDAIDGAQVVLHKPVILGELLEHVESLAARRK